MKNEKELDYKYIVHYKTYPRFERLELKNKLPNTSLRKLIKNRRTHRSKSKNKLSIDILHPLIGLAAGRTGKNKMDEDLRAYPSAGARFPLEVYLLSFRIKGLKSGIYHFSPLDNCLDVLWRGDLKDKIFKLHDDENHHFLKGMIAYFVITSIEERTTFKYGSEGKDFPLIEAGYLGANIVLLLEEAGFNPVVLGTPWCYGELETILDLNSKKETVISSIAIL